jgi:hypothetical protein
MMNGSGPRPAQRFVTEADAYNKKLDAQKQTLTLSMWRDGSGKAEVDGRELKDFVKFIENTPHGRKRVIKMLREAAELIEQGII